MTEPAKTEPRKMAVAAMGMKIMLTRRQYRAVSRRAIRQRLAVRRFVWFLLVDDLGRLLNVGEVKETPENRLALDRIAEGRNLKTATMLYWLLHDKLERIVAEEEADERRLQANLGGGFVSGVQN